MLRKVVHLLAVVSGLGLAGIIALVLIFFIQYRHDDHPLALPRPRGPHPVESKAICDSDRAGCTARAFPGARHMNFSDAGVLPSRFPFPGLLLMLGDVDGAGFLYEVSDLLRAFFNQMYREFSPRPQISP